MISTPGVSNLYDSSELNVVEINNSHILRSAKCAVGRQCLYMDYLCSRELIKNNFIIRFPKLKIHNSNKNTSTIHEKLEGWIIDPSDYLRFSKTEKQKVVFEVSKLLLSLHSLKLSNNFKKRPERKFDILIVSMNLTH